MSASPDLQDVAAAFRATMPADSHVSVFPIDALDRIGIPVVQANLIVRDEPATTGYGYGFTADRGRGRRARGAVRGGACRRLGEAARAAPSPPMPRSAANAAWRAWSIR